MFSRSPRTFGKLSLEKEEMEAKPPKDCTPLRTLEKISISPPDLVQSEASSKARQLSTKVLQEFFFASRSSKSEGRVASLSKKYGRESLSSIPRIFEEKNLGNIYSVMTVPSAPVVFFKKIWLFARLEKRSFTRLGETSLMSKSLMSMPFVARFTIFWIVLPSFSHSSAVTRFLKEMPSPSPTSSMEVKYLSIALPATERMTSDLPMFVKSVSTSIFERAFIISLLLAPPKAMSSERGTEVMASTIKAFS